MYNHPDIIEQYRQADFEQRLSLFLECPAFRDEFVGIDRKEGEERTSANLEAKRIRNRANFFSRALTFFKP